MRIVKESILKNTDIVIDYDEPFINATIIDKLKDIDSSINGIDDSIKSYGYGDEFRDYIYTASNGKEYSIRVYRHKWALK